MEQNKIEKLRSGILIRNVTHLFYGTSDFSFVFFFLKKKKKREKKKMARGRLAGLSSRLASGSWCSGTAGSFGSKPTDQDSGF